LTICTKIANELLLLQAETEIRLLLTHGMFKRQINRDHYLTFAILPTPLRSHYNLLYLYPNSKLALSPVRGLRILAPDRSFLRPFSLEPLSSILSQPEIGSKYRQHNLYLAVYWKIEKIRMYILYNVHTLIFAEEYSGNTGWKLFFGTRTERFQHYL
jgi:hypothetical protein